MIGTYDKKDAKYRLNRTLVETRVIYKLEAGQ